MCENFGSVISIIADIDMKSSIGQDCFYEGVAMDNENYQRAIEEHIKEKFLRQDAVYQGDQVSEILYRIVRKYVRDGILDVGAGTGALLTTLERHGYRRIKGIDLCPKVDFVEEGSITALAFADSSFDTIFCTEVLEHLTDDQIGRGLQELSRVSAPQANLIVTVPYNENLAFEIIVCPECRHTFHSRGHLQTFSPGRMEGILARHGFQVAFSKVYALGAMAKLPLGRFANFIFKRSKYRAIAKTLVIAAQKR